MARGRMLRRRWAPVAVMAAVGIGALVASSPLANADEAAPAFSRVLGTSGPSNGQFDNPVGLAVAGDGSVYVADALNDRIQQFSSTGAFIRSWGRDGGATRPWWHPQDLALDGAGNVYVVAPGTGVRVFSPTGVFLRSWDRPSPVDHFEPTGVAVGPNGHVYVADNYQDRVIESTSTGALVRQWPVGDHPDFYEKALGLAVAGSGDVYVIEEFSDQIHRYTATGALVSSWSDTGGYFGRGQPKAIDVTPDGRVHLVDWINFRVKVYAASGTFIEAWGGGGSAPGQFYEPQGLAIGPDGTTYVSEPSIDRVQVFGGPSAHRPDARIRSGSDALLGDGIYNTTGVQQEAIAAASTWAWSVTDFSVSLQNDGSEPDRFRVKAVGAASPGFTVSYYFRGAEVTAQVVSGSYRTPRIPPGGKHLLTVRVHLAPDAAPSSTVSRKVKVISVARPSARDSVMFTVHRE